MLTAPELLLPEQHPLALSKIRKTIFHQRTSASVDEQVVLLVPFDSTAVDNNQVQHSNPVVFEYLTMER